MAAAVQEIGRADVRRQHALLDQPVRVVARPRHDARDLAVRVELDLGLDRFEVDRAAPPARVEQRAKDV